VSLERITQRTASLIEELPGGVSVVAAAKTRSAAEIAAAIRGGVRIAGHNYVQEAEAIMKELGSILGAEVRDPDRAPVGTVSHHMIGHLQRNKVKEAVRLFDAIQTVDSLRLARAIDSACEAADRTMPILIEINSAREAQKTGVVPEEAEDLIRKVARFPRLRIEGLMTMGPLVDDPEELRPLFAATKGLFDDLAGRAIANVKMNTLSMGMSDSFRIAIEEGATMVRVGTLLFGPRH
jgi:pyridoxal phosphate enzyme (YggS family)